MVLHAFDLHLVRHSMISIIPPAQHQGPWRATSIVFLHYNISLGYIYIRHAGHKMKKTTIWLLPVVYNLQKGLLHTIFNINNLTISHHMPCKNKLDASNLSCIFYVVWGFLGRTVLTYEHVTTMVIKNIINDSL
jgi:hypothetical protein